MEYRPMGDRVIIKPATPREKTPGGLIVPDNARVRIPEGKVLAVGPGTRERDGSLRLMELKEGDTVCYGDYMGATLKVGVDECIVLRETDILAVKVKDSK